MRVLHILRLLPMLLIGIGVAHADEWSKQITVDLYGHQLTFTLHERFAAADNKCFSEETLQSSVSELMQNTQTDSLITRMNQYAAELKMDDMAYLMMLNRLTESMLKHGSEDCKTLFKYALLQKKGFDVFIGYTETSITLYGRTNVMIDNCLFIERGTKKYFDLSFNQHVEPHAEHQFVMRYEGKALPIVMNMIEPPGFSAKQAKKVIPFEHDGYLYFFTTNINQSLVEYYKELPTINISTVYLNYGLSASATASLITEMRQATSSMSTTEGVNFILRFVQATFDYKKDELVYGEEKFSFPEETLTNTYSDCEDKAMLFAVLINKIYRLKTVALYYKGADHINVAVQSWKQNIGGNFVFNDQNYIVCEPTRNGYNIGESAAAVSFASLIDW
ncbi:MAG: hypothetical protein V4590_08460 [Bacteroidota bacterium]